MDTDAGRLGIGICYDIRFPELAMCYAQRGCQLIVYPGAAPAAPGAAGAVGAAEPRHSTGGAAAAPPPRRRSRPADSSTTTPPPAGAFNTVTGPLHWELLQKARAVDNQLYVAACSPARNPDASYQAWGHSTVVGPFAEVRAARRGRQACGAQCPSACL